VCLIKLIFILDCKLTEQ